MESVRHFTRTEDWDNELDPDSPLTDRPTGLVTIDRHSSPEELDSQLNNIDDIVPPHIVLRNSYMHRHVENKASEQSHYQTELVNKIIQYNSILFLDGGVRKLFTTVLVIRELCQEIIGPFFQIIDAESGSVLTRNHYRRTIFLCSPHLLPQHYYYIRVHLPNIFHIATLTESVDSWSLERFQDLIRSTHVLLMTDQTLHSLLTSFLKISDFNLIVFDDVYYDCTQENRYNRILEIYHKAKLNNSNDRFPRLLGLSSCLIKCELSNPTVDLLVENFTKLSDQFDSKIITCEGILESWKHMRYPIYLILPFPHSKLNEVHLNFAEKLHDFIVFLKVINSYPFCRIHNVETKHSSMKSNNGFINYSTPQFQITDLDTLICIATDINVVLTEIGYWGSFQISLLYLNQLRGFPIENYQNPILISARVNLTSILQHYTSQILKNTSIKPTMMDISAKFSFLINELKHRCDQDRFNTIIFVNSRTTAVLLSRYLNILAKVNTEYECLKSQHIFSQDMNPNSVTYTTQDLYYDAIEKFRLGELNLLITDDCLLEGIDLPRSTMVIIFNRITDFSYFTLTRSRIVDSDGIYLCLCSEEEKNNLISRIQLYGQIELLYKDLLVRDLLPRDVFIDIYPTEEVSSYRLKYWGPLTERNAISILEWYCQFLVSFRDSDMYTNYKPIYRLQTCARINFFTGNEYLKYRYEIILPKSSCMVRTLNLDIPLSNTKLNAKGLAAYHVCIELHRVGELNENLTPKIKWIKQCESNLSSLQFYDEKEVQLYSINVANCLNSQIESNQTLYLQSYFLKEELNSSINYPAKSFAFLSVTALNLHTLPNIELNGINKRIDYGQNTVEFIEPIQITLSESDLKDIHLFNSTFFQLIIGNSNLLEYDYKNSSKRYLIVPTNLDLSTNGADISYKTSIDFNMLSNLKNWPFLTQNFSNEQYADYYKGMIVRKNYVPTSNSDKPNYLRVIGSEPNTTIESPPPDISKASSYREYFKKHHQFTITNPNQVALILVPFSNKIVNRLKRYEPNHVIKTKSSVKGGVEMYGLETLSFPELLTPVPLLGLLTPEYRVIPSICRRVESLLLTLEFCQKLKLEVPLYSCLSALTLKRCEEGFNLERLEFFGDSCLAFIVANHIFLVFPNENQGVLSNVLSHRVKNTLLLKLSLREELQLPQYLSAREFNPRTNWSPPGFIFKNAQNKAQSNSATNEENKINSFDFSNFAQTLTPSVYTHQELSNKSIADSFEALLATIISNNGLSSLIVFLYKFDCMSVVRELKSEIIGDLTTKFKYSPNDFLANPFDFYLQGRDCFRYIYSNYYKPKCWTVEIYTVYLKYFHNTHTLFAKEKLKFNCELSPEDIYILVQALTHDSYIINSFTPSYHRLMFLGDAIINYLIASYLMTHAPQNYQPKDLHIIKTCVLLNINLARICINHKYYEDILLTNHQLQSGIDLFVHYVKNINEKVFFKCQLDLVSQCISGKIYIEESVNDAQKVLSDVYKSLITSTYIISGYDLLQVWKCFGEELSHSIELFLMLYKDISF